MVSKFSLSLIQFPNKMKNIARGGHLLWLIEPAAAITLTLKNSTYLKLVLQWVMTGCVGGHATYLCGC